MNLQQVYLILWHYAAHGGSIQLTWAAAAKLVAAIKVVLITSVGLDWTG